MMEISQTCEDDTQALLDKGVEMVPEYFADTIDYYDDCNGETSDTKISVSCDMTDSTASDSIRSTCEDAGGKLVGLDMKLECKIEDVSMKIIYDNVHYCLATSCNDENFVDAIKTLMTRRLLTIIWTLRVGLSLVK